MGFCPKICRDKKALLQYAELYRNGRWKLLLDELQNLVYDVEIQKDGIFIKYENLPKLLTSKER